MMRVSALIAAMLLFAAVALADDNDDSYWEQTFTFSEDFNEEFPPAGWIIEHTNRVKTWEQGPCNDYDYKCAVVKGHYSGPSDERLITPEIKCTNEEVLSISMTGEDGSELLDTLSGSLKIEKSYNYDNEIDADWHQIEYMPYDVLEEERFRVALHYTGDENTQMWMIGSIELSILGDCKVTYLENDNSSFSCSCGVSEDAGGLLLIFLMAAAGLLAQFISTRKPGNVE